MQTRHLKTLVQIAQVGSFATAANQLNMTLSTLSMQMKTLEEELQVSMFDRSHRPPKLTPIGRKIAEKAQIVLNAENALLESSHETKGLLFLKNAKIKAPKANFDLETALSEKLEERVLAGQLDAAILTASKQSEAGLKYDVLREETLVYALPAKTSKLSIENTALELPFLQFNPNSGIGKLIANHVRKLTSKSNSQPIVLDSVEAIMECVNRRYANETVTIVPTSGKTLSPPVPLSPAWPAWRWLSLMTSRLVGENASCKCFSRYSATALISLTPNQKCHNRTFCSQLFEMSILVHFQKMPIILQWLQIQNYSIRSVLLKVRKNLHHPKLWKAFANGRAAQNQQLTKRL